jgi:hypothetical protein
VPEFVIVAAAIAVPDTVVVNVAPRVTGLANVIEAPELMLSVSNAMDPVPLIDFPEPVNVRRLCAGAEVKASRSA